MVEVAPGNVPTATYRVQLRPGFGFAEVAELADYLAELGVSHVYLSPILAATPGSTHGYDVVDHTRLSEELGGAAAFRAMAARLRAHGLRLVVDIVPNHMAIPVPERLNRPFWSVLRDGLGSPYAHWFDIDWAAQDGRVLLPVLAEPIGDCLGELRVERAGGEPVLRYRDHEFPLRDGNAATRLGRADPASLADVLDAQWYRLAYWRVGAVELNYRRFFDITGLIGLRMEDADVFAATHRLVVDLVREGLIDGLRVDHPDGLADPRGYLERLAAVTGGRCWIVVEKILGGGEQLPRGWPCAGTTGYDALAAVGGLFVDPAGREPLTRAYTALTGGPCAFAPVVEQAKRDIIERTLTPEVERLTSVVAAACHDDLALRDHPRPALRAALVELLVALPVYRAYVTEPSTPAAKDLIAAVARTARARLPAAQHPTLDLVRDLVAGRHGTRDPRRAEVVTRFQQTSAAVTAKGVEDTALYRFSRLAALNEVGGHPDRFGVAPAEFHAFCHRLARDWPATLTTLSTHDTKRQEDVRARLAVLTEIPARWQRAVTTWWQLAERHRAGGAPEPDTEYLMWQTVVGAWPIDATRLTAYLTKAAREAKTATSWTEPDAAYEDALRRFAAAVLADEEIRDQIGAFLALIDPFAHINGLGQKLIQLTMPGVPDCYQGCELPGYALVDPDNRRPVDFARRRELLASLDAGKPAHEYAEQKLLVTRRALRLRRRRPAWFGPGAAYAPLAAYGPAAEHLVAFRRADAVIAVATRLPLRLTVRGGWDDTVLPLPGGRWHDVLGGLSFDGFDGEAVAVSALLSQLPVALLVRDAAAAG